MSKSKVYFTKNISPEMVVTLYRALGENLTGKVGVKVHSGEAGNQNYLRPEFFKPIVERVNGTIVECNTAYPGERNTTEKHKQLLKNHGWTKYYSVDIMDAEGPDMVLPIKNGLVLKEDYVGKNLAKYDSLLVISHFKGHPMGGFGGALKQLSIGCASSAGKAWIHSSGETAEQEGLFDRKLAQDSFLESMADAASAVVDYFKGNMAFINVMCNMSVDCDCCAVAEDPCLADIGMLASLDPIALDQACIDLVYSSNDAGKQHFIERVESRNGLHTIESAAKHGFGMREYELIDID